LLRQQRVIEIDGKKKTMKGDEKMFFDAIRWFVAFVFGVLALAGCSGITAGTGSNGGGFIGIQGDPGLGTLVANKLFDAMGVTSPEDTITPYPDRGQSVKAWTPSAPSGTSMPAPGGYNQFGYGGVGVGAVPISGGGIYNIQGNGNAAVLGNGSPRVCHQAVNKWQIDQATTNCKLQGGAHFTCYQAACAAFGYQVGSADPELLDEAVRFATSDAPTPACSYAMPEVEADEGVSRDTDV